MDPKELREQTRSEHEATEALMLLGGPRVSVEEYGRALLSLLPLMQSWEAWAGRCGPEEFKALVGLRRRSHLLRADLAALGIPEGAPQIPTDWESVVTGGEPAVAEGIFAGGFPGALYVIEGSTLGGRYLARHLISVLGPEYEAATSYFQGHGDQTGVMWREVTARIREVPDALAETTIRAAKRCFGVFGAALRAGIPRSDH